MIENTNNRGYENGKEKRKMRREIDKANYLWLKKKDYIKAEDLYKQILKQSPENLNALIMYGELLLTMNRYDEANIIYERAYKIDKDVAENIANYYESINGYEEWARYWRNKSK